MIYLYPSDFVIDRKNEHILITFRKLLVDTVGTEINVPARLKALGDVVAQSGGSVVYGITVRGNTIKINGVDSRIGSSVGFMELAKAVYSYDVNYNDSVYLRLSKRGLVQELQKGKMTSSGLKVPTNKEFEKIADTMMYNWLTMIAQQRALLNVVKINRQSKGQLVPSLISTGVPVMEMQLTMIPNKMF